MKNMLARAIEIASKEFVNKQDKSGTPYILHCLWVMDRVRHLGEEHMIAAVLHDLLEDTDWTVKQLLDEGFEISTVLAIDLLTHKDEDSYEEYIDKISTHSMAREIKLRDLEHNSKITRLKGLRKKDIDRIYKYNKAYVYLSN